MSSGFYAHTKDGVDESGWHLLKDHLSGVAEAARRFAEPFGAGAWARRVGLWHDTGKYSDAFQAYIRSSSVRAPRGPIIDHSTAGGQHAVTEDDVLGHLLAYPVTGARIETGVRRKIAALPQVAPIAGARIETSLSRTAPTMLKCRSHRVSVD